MRSEDALGLPFDDGLHIGRKAGMQRFLIVISGVVLSILDRFETLASSAPSLCLRSIQARCSLLAMLVLRSGFGLAKMPRYALQLSRKFASLQ